MQLYSFIFPYIYSYITFSKGYITVHTCSDIVLLYSSLPESVFAGLGHTEYLSLADNSLPDVPHHILRQMPVLKTLDISRCRLQAISDMDFQVSTKVIKGCLCVHGLCMHGNQNLFSCFCRTFPIYNI